MSTLAEDFKSCRQRLNVSLEDIAKSTRVPVSLFVTIEDGTFFSNPSFTRTYIRSFVRMYGKAIKLDETDTLRALDEEEAEMYTGFLHRKYVLGEVEKPVVVPAIPDERKTQAKSTIEQPIVPIKVVAPSKPEPQRTPIETDRTVDWADMNAKINRPRQNSNITIYLVLALLMILVATSAIYIWYNPLDSSSSQVGIQAPESNIIPQVVEPTDSLLQNTGVEPVPALSLPETLKVVVYAINEKLDPVRVSSDLKDRVNPYWIELGAGREFEFRDTLIVRADPFRFALIYNGHLINSFNDFRFDDDSLNFRITRNLLLQRPESQRTGTLPENVRPPILDF
jgi:hypothetical protein